MLLSPEDAALFFKLMPAFQFFCNRHLNIVKSLDTIKDYKTISNEKRIKLRNAVYKKPELIDRFVQENPFDFSAEELSIVSSWKNFLAGSFFIDRILKKYAIFIFDQKVYGVLALMEPLDEVFGGRPFPVYVKTVLLPFKGKIIYDGLMEGYNIFFGSGISRSSSDQYRAAKQKGTIIESLDPDWTPPKTKPQFDKDWKPVLEELLEKAAQLRAGANSPAISSPAFSLVRASLEFARTALEHPDDLEYLDKALHKVILASNKAEKVMYFMDY
jgi:hypothetical protein